MEKAIVVCGDSFNVGIGCRDLKNEPYGALLGKELNKPVINLAKGSSTNFSIYLQAKYAVDKLKNKTDLVLVSNTSYDRVNWFPIDYEHKSAELTNANVNYHQYPPYGPASYITILDSPMKDDPEYNGAMFTENYMGVIDYWENFACKNRESGYYGRFKDEPKERTKILYDFAASIHDNRIDRIQSIGVLTMAHQLLKKAGIRHLMLIDDVKEYSKFMDPTNLVYVSWGELSNNYPDDIPSLHTSAEGQKVVFNTVLTKLKENSWI